MLTSVQWQRVHRSLTRLSQRYGHTGYTWPLRAFGPREPDPPIEPSHIRGEGKFLFPESIKDKSQFVMPPVNEVSKAAYRARKRQLWHTKIKKLRTIEEKIFELNMPRYYGWRPYILKEGDLVYDPLPKIQYITSTSLMEEPGLPNYYNSLLSEEDLNATVQQIKSQIEDALVFEYTSRDQSYQLTKDQLEDKMYMETFMAKAVSKQVNRILINNLYAKYQHLLEAQVDFDPRLEAFWFFGGLTAPLEAVKMRANRSWLKEFINEPVNQCFQYYGTPLIHLRHNLPLQELMSLEQSEEFRSSIPHEPLDPRTVGYFNKDLKRATVIPGFWPGDQNEFGFMSYNSSAHLSVRHENMKDDRDALIAQAVLGSFSWLYTQACYQGFSTFQDPTYPLVNQMILTNGKWWTFSAYQLNTTTMHLDAINKNKKSNLCWVTDSMKLFERIENGKVLGLNEDVLKHLIKFYANVPQAKEGIEMKPYLGNEQVVANIEESERREWLESKYKHLMSNRERHLKIPEIKDWQRIYMIKFKTRQLDKKRDPWEFGINPYSRRLDDHSPEYIPKSHRAYPRSKKKFKQNYYPHVSEEELNAQN